MAYFAANFKAALFCCQGNCVEYEGLFKANLFDCLPIRVERNECSVKKCVLVPSVRAAVHVGGGGAGGHRLPRGAGAERAAAVPGGGRAAGRAGLRAGAPDAPAHAHQARRPGNRARALAHAHAHAKTRA